MSASDSVAIYPFSVLVDTISNVLQSTIQRLLSHSVATRRKQGIRMCCTLCCSPCLLSVSNEKPRNYRQNHEKLWTEWRTDVRTNFLGGGCFSFFSFSRPFRNIESAAKKKKQGEKTKHRERETLRGNEKELESWRIKNEDKAAKSGICFAMGGYIVNESSGPERNAIHLFSFYYLFLASSFFLRPSISHQSCV